MVCSPGGFNQLFGLGVNAGGIGRCGGGVSGAGQKFGFACADVAHALDKAGVDDLREAAALLRGQSTV